jgi:hypothetical protein
LSDFESNTEQRLMRHHHRARTGAIPIGRQEPGRDQHTGDEQVFRKGDSYGIEPGVAYAQKSAPGTEILFIKVPPGNDKMPVDTTPEVEAWFREPIKE